MRHLDRLLTTDETSRQHMTHTKLNTLIHTHSLFLSFSLSFNAGCLTKDETSWQAADDGRNIQTAHDPHKTQHINTHTHSLSFSLSFNAGCLTKDETSWQAADDGRNIQTAHDPHKAQHINTHTLSLSFSLSRLTRGAWRKTRHLDRLLTTDETSRQHMTHTKLNTLIHTHSLSLSLVERGVPDERQDILTGCWRRTKHPDSTWPTQSSTH